MIHRQTVGSIQNVVSRAHLHTMIEKLRGKKWCDVHIMHSEEPQILYNKLCDAPIKCVSFSVFTATYFHAPEICAYPFAQIEREKGNTVKVHDI